MSSNYDVVIRPDRGWLQLNLRDVWHYRDLLLLLVHRDFVAKYKQTILGPLWFVVQPLLLTGIFIVIFSGVAAIPTDGMPPTLFYMAGLLPWSYFAQTFQHASGTLIVNAGLFGKVYFPRLVVPLSAAISNLIALALQLAMFGVFWLYFKLLTPAGAAIHVSPAIVLFPLIVIQVAVLSLGVGLWLSAATAKYRDLTFVAGFIVQVWMYATPVIYPLSQIPDSWRWIAVLNPMTMPVEATRRLLLGEGLVVPADIAMSAVMSILLLTSGLLVFNRIEMTFVDTV